jgi:hypothetical protein
MGRLAGTIDAAVTGHRDSRLANVGMKRLTGSLSRSSFFDEHHHRERRDRLRLRRDAENRIGRHAAPGFLVTPPDSAFVHGLAVAQDEHHGAGETLLIHVLLERVIEPGETFCGEAERCRTLSSDRHSTCSDRDEEPTPDSHVPSKGRRQYPIAVSSRRIGPQGGPFRG